MAIITASSTKTSLEEVIDEIKNTFSSITPKMIIYFASSSFAPQEISSKMKNAFPDSETFGCSTAGEIVSGKMLKNSVVAMALDESTAGNVKIEIVKDIKTNAKENVEKALISFGEHFDQKASDLSPEKYVGIILIDGLSVSEEIVMDKIGDLTNVLFIGGSAGDDLKFDCTYVYANGAAYTNAAILAILEPTAGFDFIKTQSFCQLETTLTATKVNEQSREVNEFNGKPAAEAYAEALQSSVEDVSKHFMNNPVGLMVTDDVFVRSPQQIKGNSMVFYCAVKEGMELTLLESTNIINDTKEALDNKLKELGNIEGIINFNCILRTLALEAKDLTDDYGQIFSDIPTIGFSTYGEEFIGHINQTSTMLVFK